MLPKMDRLLKPRRNRSRGRAHSGFVAGSTVFSLCHRFIWPQTAHTVLVDNPGGRHKVGGELEKSFLVSLATAPRAFNHPAAGCAVFCRGPTVANLSPPVGEPLSRDFTMTANGENVPVCLGTVATADPEKRVKIFVPNDASYDDHTPFGAFDLSGQVAVTITCPEPVPHGQTFTVRKWDQASGLGKSKKLAC